MADQLGSRAGHAWWSRRLLDVVESLGLAGPLRGGRRLVRTEAVLSLRRSGNLVVAMVRDPEEETHKARIAVRTFGGAEWARIEKALAARAGYAAALLAGSMPEEIDRVFTALGLSLFPTGADDLAMDCSCDDWQRPCAHIAAAFYQLAKSFDTDPFTLLALRGRERDPFLDGLRTHRARTAPGDTDGSPVSATPAGTALPTAIEPFWSASADPERDRGTGEATAGGGPDAVLDQCGPLVVESLGDLRDLLRPAYEVFASDRRDDRPVTW